MTPWLQTVTGRAFVFSAPVVETPHLITEVAHDLARLPRFGGHTGQVYSVAQHSVLCADAAEMETGDREFAAFCLLHDAHETWLSDVPNPVMAALLEGVVEDARHDKAVVRLVAELRAENLKRAWRTMKHRIDDAVFDAAGLDPARHIDFADAIAAIDLRALRTERDDLMLPAPLPWDAPIEKAKRLTMATDHIKPWPKEFAEG